MKRIRRKVIHSSHHLSVNDDCLYDVVYGDDYDGCGYDGYDYDGDGGLCLCWIDYYY